MGVKLLILLALLIGVLYCIHLLVKDYQAITAGRLLRFLTKRDVTAQNYSKPHVRWRKILLHDPIQCARYLYCDIGAQPADSEIRRGFTYMLTLEPHAEDKPAHETFSQAYHFGKSSASGHNSCKTYFATCPFNASLLFELIQYLLHTA